MKRKFTNYLFGTLAMLFASVSASQAQINPTNLGALDPLVSDGLNTIFAHGNAAFTLTASTVSSNVDGEENVPFTNYIWHVQDADGLDVVADLAAGTAAVTGTISNVLTVSGLAPGFYTFVAQGQTAAACDPDMVEYTVFVLRPIDVTLTLSEDGILEYCTDAMPEDQTITVTAEYDAATAWNGQTDLGSSNPALSAFELRYRWYKVADGQPAPDFSTATPLATAGATHTINSTDDGAVGSWNYYVAIDYTVKASGPYSEVLGGSTAPTVIRVTLKPGKPTITIVPTP